MSPLISVPESTVKQFILKLKKGASKESMFSAQLTLFTYRSKGWKGAESLLGWREM